MFPEHQISILEWFLKDHVPLKTGLLAAENSASNSAAENYFPKYIKNWKHLIYIVIIFYNITY